MIFKSLLLSLCLLTGCDRNITRNSTKLQRIVKVQLPPDDSSYELEYTYWDNELEIICEWIRYAFDHNEGIADGYIKPL